LPDRTHISGNSTRTQQRQGTFLVVIPTRNRAQLAKAAIESVLQAGVSRVKILVSDNSTDTRESAALRSICEQHSQNGVSYVRPESSLSMAKHWDWVMQQALKDPAVTHFFYLTDRMVFKPGALVRLCQLAQRYPGQVITCSFDGLNDNEEPITVTQAFWTDKVYEINSVSTLNVCSRMQFDYFLPRVLNTLVPRTVMERILDRFGNCFSSFAPDFNFCFRYLLLFDSFLFVDRALLVHYALARSNGATLQAVGLPNKDNEDLPRTPSGKFCLEGTLFPELITVGNTIVYEYLQLQNGAGSQRFPQVDKHNYLEYLSGEVADFKDPQRRMEWENVLRHHNEGKPVQSEWGNGVRRSRSATSFVKAAARRVAEVWINVSPEFILLVTPNRLRKRLAANKWKFRHSQRALFCALHFECPSGGDFRWGAHSRSLECTVLTESVR
jgi:glycosyltransferase involved in cell wall biosynthesis